MRLRALWIVAAALLVAAAMRAQSPALRFHHIHLRVADPAAAMNKYVRANGCTSIVLQGIGVGVRCGRAYLLFERSEGRPEGLPHQAMVGQTSRFAGTVKVSGSGDRAIVSASVAVEDPDVARQWIHDRLGLNPAPSITFVKNAAGRVPPDEIADIGFAAADPAPALAQLSSSSIQVLSHSEDATLVSGPGGLPIEIVRDPGLDPDAYWCPMHPDVRSPVPGTCSRCGMTLVPIPPPAFGDYRLRVDTTPLGDHRDRLTLRITDPAAPDRAPAFLNVHDRPLHLFIVSRDLQSFQHVHPDETADGAFTIDVTWPAPGIYGVFADFYPAKGTPQLLQTTVVTNDYRGPAFPAVPRPRVDARESRTDAGVTVSLSSPRLVAAREQTLTFTLTDAASGSPVTDLEPYLGAPGHLFVVSADSVDATHSHPVDTRVKGPDVKFDLTFPRPGIHKLWVQFQRRGVVLTLPFVVKVE